MLLQYTIFYPQGRGHSNDLIVDWMKWILFSLMASFIRMSFPNLKMDMDGWMNGWDIYMFVVNFDALRRQVIFKSKGDW